MPELKKAKPQIEDVVGDYIDGDNLKNLLDFIEFLKANKLTPRFQVVNSWLVRYKNKNICYIKMFDCNGYWRPPCPPYMWTVFPNFCPDEFEKYVKDDDMKELILNNIHDHKCRENCTGYVNKTLFGKKFDRICFCHSIRIYNPGGAELECLKRFILVLKTINADLEKARQNET